MTRNELNSLSCNGRRYLRISVTLIYIYVSDITFTDLSPVPVRSAVKSILHLGPSRTCLSVI